MANEPDFEGAMIYEATLYINRVSDAYERWIRMWLFVGDQAGYDLDASHYDTEINRPFTRAGVR